MSASAATTASSTLTAFPILGPLTTTFTPSPSCLTGTWFIGDPTGDNYNQFGPPSTSDCLPPGYNVGSSGVYSPGVCPAGYVTACSEQVSLPGQFTGEVLTCCPSSYTCLDYSDWRRDAQLWCTSGFTETVVVPMTLTTNSSRYTVTTTFAPLQGLNAYGVALAISSASNTSSMPLTDTQVPATGAATAPVTRPIPTSSPAPTFSSTPTLGPATVSQTDHRASLDAGPKAGIAIGVIIGCALLGAAVWLRYRHRKQPVDLGGSKDASEMPLKTWQHPCELAGKQKPAELGPPNLHELPDTSSSNGFPVQLP